MLAITFSTPSMWITLLYYTQALIIEYLNSHNKSRQGYQYLSTESMTSTLVGYHIAAPSVQAGTKISYHSLDA